MPNGLGTRYRQKSNFTEQLMGRAMAGANDLIHGAKTRQAQGTGILILSSGILHQ
jgi:hypothetical protein